MSCHPVPGPLGLGGGGLENRSVEEASPRWRSLDERSGSESCEQAVSSFQGSLDCPGSACSERRV